MPVHKKTTQYNARSTTVNPQNLLCTDHRTRTRGDARSRGLRSPVWAILWALFFATSTLTLAACGNKKTSEPIIDVAPTTVPATTAPATDVPPTEVPPTEVPTEAPIADASATESPLLTPDSPLTVAESPLQRSSAFESPLVIEGTAQAGFGGLGGRVLNTGYDGVQLPYPLISVRLAPTFLEPQTDEKLFILSGAESPGTMTDEEGYFLFDALEPREYVLIVGDIIGFHQVIAGEDGKAQLYVVEADEVINAGLIEVELP